MKMLPLKKQIDKTKQFLDISDEEQPATTFSSTNFSETDITQKTENGRRLKYNKYNNNNKWNCCQVIKTNVILLPMTFFDELQSKSATMSIF